ncbi:MAG TPA: transcription termination factor NusA [Thermodesulfobacteriota bacterium]
MLVDLNRVIEQVGKDKGISKEILIEALENALLSAAKKEFGPQREIEARYNEQLGEVELFQFKTVVEKVTNTYTEISLEDAREIDPEAQIGDSLGIKMDSASFGRIAAQTAKQVIIQKVRDAERDIIYNEFQERQGELVNGIVQRFERGNIIVDLGRTEAVLLPRDQVPREAYRQGDRIRAYVMDIKKTPKGPQILLSRTHPGLLIKLFELEVPEISEGIVKIEAAAREPGGRAKIAVSSRDPDVDPVGACVGMKGSRVQAVVQELRGEKIDIVPYSEDPVRFVVNALAPAEVSDVRVDEENKTMEVLVPDDQLSLAIGKRGQNVRLAAKLTGWKLDIKSESRMSASEAAAAAAEALFGPRKPAEPAPEEPAAVAATEGQEAEASPGPAFGDGANRPDEADQSAHAEGEHGSVGAVPGGDLGASVEALGSEVDRATTAELAESAAGAVSEASADAARGPEGER